jgi:hypothetical protein
MDPQINAAIITAIASFIVALFSIYLSRDAKNIATRAEEASKRTEQIRIKATEAGEKILKVFAEIIIPAETILFFLKMTPSKQLDNQTPEKEKIEEQIMTRYKTIAKAVGDMRNLMYATAIYTTPEIRSQIKETLKPFTPAVYLILSTNGNLL